MGQESLGKEVTPEQGHEGCRGVCKVGKAVHRGISGREVIEGRRVLTSTVGYKQGTKMDGHLQKLVNIMCLNIIQ